MFAVFIKKEGSLRKDARIEGHARGHIMGNAICHLLVSTHIGDLMARNAHSFDFLVRHEYSSNEAKNSYNLNIQTNQYYLKSF